VKLFAKGKGQAAAQPQASAFSPIDRIGLLGLLDQVVNGGQSGVLELREPRGNWVYAFQAGALTHASGGRVRGARHAFDLLWEFQSGEFMFAPGVNPSLAGNLYIDKGRLTDLLRRSQAALQGPSAPYIPADQQRPIAPANRPYTPAWQPGAAPGQFAPQPPPGAPQWPPAGQPVGPPAPAWGAGGYPQQPGYPAAPYPGAPYQGPPPQGQPYPPQAYPQPPGPMRPPAGAPQPAYPNYPQPPMAPPGTPPQMLPPQGMPPQMMPPQQAAPAPARPITPPSFSVPPMPIPRKREAAPTYRPPVPAPAPAAPSAPGPAKPVAPKDDLAALRASLVAQAPPVRPVSGAPGWGVRTVDGAVAAPPPAAGLKSKGKGKDKDKDRGARTKKDSRLMASIKVQLIKFLLWACERKYSPDDHWTLKDAFEVSTMELRDQFIGAFSESLKASKKRQTDDDDDMDDMAAGRMRGRGRRH